MAFTVVLPAHIEQQLGRLARRDVRRMGKVLRALDRLSEDPTYPGLHSHVFRGAAGPEGEQIWQSYVENRAPQAWRIWWYYGPGEGKITITEIGPHSD